MNLKKRFDLRAALFVCSVFIFTGCADKADINVKGDTSNIEENASSDILLEEKTSEDEYEKVAFAPSEYMTLGDYSSIEIPLDVPEKLSEEDIISFIDNTLMAYPDYEISSKEFIDNGDTADISFSAYIKGNTEKEAEEEGYVIRIGSGVLIQGFEDSLIGKKPGETYSIELTYPEDAGNNEYIGKELVFDITVNSILSVKTYTYENVDIQYLKDKMGVYSKDALYSDTSSHMYKMLSDIQNEKKSEIADIYLSMCEYSFPGELIENRFRQEKDIFINHYFDGDEERYLNIEETNDFDREEFETQLIESVKRDTAFGMAAQLIADKENITVSDEELEDYIKYAAESSSEGVSVEDFIKTYDTGFQTGKEYFHDLLLKEKVESFLADRIVFVFDDEARLSDYIYNTKD